jgi:hypothetical protein
MELDPNAVLGSFTIVFIAAVGWMLKREFDIGVLQGRQKKAHERIDAIQKDIKKLNGHGGSDNGDQGN